MIEHVKEVRLVIGDESANELLAKNGWVLLSAIATVNEVGEHWGTYVLGRTE